MSSRCLSDRLLTLHAVRLAGFADEEALADRALLPLEEIRIALEGAARDGELETMSFADARGWILTESGLSRLADLLEEEASAAEAQGVVARTVTAFEDPQGINARFVETVSQWQLQSTAPTQGSTVADGKQGADALLAELAAFGGQLRLMLTELIEHLPRFGRYPAQYDLAVSRARAEGLGWVTGVGILSCHVVWAELHQDLRSTAGGDRATDPGSRR